MKRKVLFYIWELVDKELITSSIKNLRLTKNQLTDF